MPEHFAWLMLCRTPERFRRKLRSQFLVIVFEMGCMYSWKKQKCDSRVGLHQFRCQITCRINTALPSLVKNKKEILANLVSQKLVGLILLWMLLMDLRHYRPTFLSKTYVVLLLLSAVYGDLAVDETTQTLEIIQLCNKTKSCVDTDTVDELCHTFHGKKKALLAFMHLLLHVGAVCY